MIRTIVVGAGIAGLLAAHELVAGGHEVVVVDKGLAPGGRVATRRVGDATFDHGAQFLTARDARFRPHLDAWVAAGTARIFFRGSPDLAHDDTAPGPAPADGHPRYRGAPTMRRLAEELAVGLDVHLGAVVTRLDATGRGFAIAGRHRDAPDRPLALHGDALLLTPPLPQTLALLATGPVPLSPAHHDELAAIAYDPCIAVLAVPERPPALPARGVLRLPADEPVVWLTDNLVTGASATPAVTVHAGADWSRHHLDAPDVEVARQLLALARPHLGTAATPVHVHRWRYARPTSRAAADAVLDTTTGAPLAIAGDGLTGGRIEGAALSGLAAAAALLDVL